MTRLYARTLIAIGLIGVLLASGRVAWVGLTHGASPLTTKYFACPEGGPAHVHGCHYVDWGRLDKDLILLPGRHAAEKCGLCEECLKGEMQTRTASTRSRSPFPEGTPQQGKSQSD